MERTKTRSAAALLANPPVITSPNILVLNQGKVTITGTAPAGATLEVFDANNPQNKVTTMADPITGMFSAMLMLSVGAHTITAQIVVGGTGSDTANVQVIAPAVDTMATAAR